MTVRRGIEYGLAIAGAGALAWCAWVWIGAAAFQSTARRRFEGALGPQRAAPAKRTAPAASKPAAIVEGDLVARLDIPRLKLSTMVIEGDGERDLRRAVGHIPGTAFPWQSGNTALAGHRDTFFRPLRFIRTGDSITLRTLDGAFRYRVVKTAVVSPDDVAVLQPTPRSTLTLVTCYPFHYIGAAPKRFIVTAERLPAG